MASIDSLRTRRDLTVGETTYSYYSLPAAEEAVQDAFAAMHGEQTGANHTESKDELGERSGQRA